MMKNKQDENDYDESYTTYDEYEEYEQDQSHSGPSAVPKLHVNPPRDFEQISDNDSSENAYYYD